MANNHFGGGRLRQVNISSGKQNTSKVMARVGIFGSGITIFTNGNLAGKIGMPYWDNQLAHEALIKLAEVKQGVRFSDDTLMFQVFNDIYSALRRTLHVLHGNYGRSYRTPGEKSDLKAALAMLQRVNQSYLALRTINIDQYQDKIQGDVEVSLQKIGLRVRDQKKREARDLLLLVANIMDSREQLNPSAKLAQVVAIRNRLIDRVSNILSIEPRIIEQRQSLMSIIDICELRFRLVEDFLVRLLPNLHVEYFQSHGGQDLSARVAKRLNVLAAEIAPVDLNPFFRPGQRIGAELSSAAKNITASNFPQAEEQVGTILASMKLRVLRSDIEHFITRLTKHLFDPEKELTVSEIERLKRGFRNLRGRLAKVDESGFKYPVCKRSLSLISQAEKPLRHLAVAKNEALISVKEKLVETARLL